jgi:tetratricopeptide (TPR) repeat protein
LQICPEPSKGGEDIEAARQSVWRGSAQLLEDAVTHLTSPRRRPASLARQFGLALALASGTAVLAVPGFTDAAYAQKKKKKDEAADPAKPVYSKEFVEAYQPADTALKAPGADPVALRPQVLALVPLAVSADERQALGGMIFNTGITAKDPAMQLQGVDMMLASGKVQPADVGRFNLVGFQVASGLKQYDQARVYLQRAIDANYTAANLTTADLQMNMAELYFTEDRNVEGLQYLSDAIATYKAKGQPIDQRWYRRGVSVAYNNEIVPQVYDFVTAWVIDNPAPENWRDAVNLTRNLNDFDPQALLDLLRLGKAVETLKEKNDFIYYIEAADARRLPKEVKDIIEQAAAQGAIPKGSDTWVEEQLKIASGRIASDRAELPALERDASSAAAGYRTVVAAGDAFLNYGEFAKAATFYEKSLSLAGVDRNLALNRLGIAQIAAGNPAAARATLAQVDGVRAPIAKLWGAYAAQKEAGAMVKDTMASEAPATTGL